LTAIQILWVNLITDGLPATALSIDPHEKDIMKRKPRNAKESILSKELMWDIIIVGTLIGIGTLILFWLYLGSGLEKAQTIAFNALVLFEVARLQMIRSRYNLGIFSNTWLVLAVVASLILQMIVVYSPLNVIFGVVPLELTDWLMISSFAVGLYLINKVYYYWRDLKVKA